MALMLGAPKKQVVRQDTRKQTFTVRTVPAGGEVSLGQDPPRTAPTKLEASYQVKLVSRERSEIYPIIGIATGAVMAGVGTVMMATAGKDKPTLGYVLLFLGIADLISMPNRYATYRSANQTARGNARVELVDTPLDLTVKWPGSPPQQARLGWPQQRFITVGRDRATTFDAALIAWAEAGERTPSAEGLFNLGSAYAARAIAHRDAEDTRKALDYFERYLQTDNVPDARRAKVEELSRPLRGTP